MARDNYIIRPDRTAPRPKAAMQTLTREQRINLLLCHVLPIVRVSLAAKNPTKQVRSKQ